MVVEVYYFSSMVVVFYYLTSMVVVWYSITLLLWLWYSITLLLWLRYSITLLLWLWYSITLLLSPSFPFLNITINSNLECSTIIDANYVYSKKSTEIGFNFRRMISTDNQMLLKLKQIKCLFNVKQAGSRSSSRGYG